ncbi:MAG: FAD-dependent oxidoreductase [Lentisphaerae bacterium]|nr:FAD-dependent oxidoreductase [Lentisphaerota bacterium]
MAMETVTHRVQFCVIGGGLAGMCAAIAAARHGVKTLIMQERPVFGGNASSEIRMWVCGSPHQLETGLVEEFRLENLYRNTYVNFSVWDSILFEKVRFQENLISLLNCSCLSAEMDGSKIHSVTGWQMTTQQFHKVEADYFADCSGDSVLAPLTGAEFRLGREAQSEFGESLAQKEPDRKTMGLSCLIQARETSSPKKFIPPSWAYTYPDDTHLTRRGHRLEGTQNFWWMELGGEQDSIHDTEEIRDELLKTAFGIWDHIKNHGDHGADNWELDWVGFLPGKRESRRYVGDYILHQADVQSGGHFDDTVAYGGWPIDDHHPGGIRYDGPPNINIVPKTPYGIPLRCLYSKNIENLWFAGRNISTTHTGLSSTRVMATCATLGQAVGCAVCCAVKNGNLPPRETASEHIREIQNLLMDDDCYLPDFRREIPEICRNAKLTASSGDPESLRNGIDRELDGNSNLWHCRTGDRAEYDFGEEKSIGEIRLVFDSDLKRPKLNVVANYWLQGKVFTPPSTLVSAFELLADGKVVYHTAGNYQRLIRIPVDIRARKLTLRILGFAGQQDSGGVFAFDAQEKRKN